VKRFTTLNKPDEFIEEARTSKARDDRCDELNKSVALSDPFFYTCGTFTITTPSGVASARAPFYATVTGPK
jgi:hypothetical protein